MPSSIIFVDNCIVVLIFQICFGNGFIMFRTHHARNAQECPKKEARLYPVKPSAPLIQLSKQLPSSVSLGCAGWNFLGWKGLVWDSNDEVKFLTNKTISAYAQHPLFKAIGIDRSYFDHFNEMDYVEMARFVEDDPHFKFLLKAPSSVTDCAIRDQKGRYQSLNNDFLNVRMAMHDFVYPIINGLGEKAGPMIFQLAPIPQPLLPTQKECYEYIDRITQFFTDLPKEVEGETPVYGLEVRTPAIYTKRLLNQLRPTGVRLVVGIHPSMPNIERQTAAQRFFEDPDAPGEHWQMSGPLIVRWALNPHQRHGVGKFTYSPYNKMVHPDIDTRTGIAKLVAIAEISQQKSYVIVNNKAEGCAPLSVVDLAKQIAYEIKKAS